MYAIINERHYQIAGGNLTLELDAIGSFEVEIYLEEIGNKFYDLILEDIEVYYKDKLLTSGKIISRPTIEINDQDVYIVELNCQNELIRLSQERAKSDAHYQDQSILAIISDLISFTTGWTFTLINYTGTDVTTIDLKGKETLFSQITTVIFSIPNLHFRYGGLDSLGNRILEVGVFENIYTFFDNVFELEMDEKSSTVYKRVEAFGGFSSTERIDLGAAIADGRALTSPDYIQFPIITDGIYFYVENQNLTKGYNVTKRFDLQKTENDTTPTVAEINEAGFALWQKAVSFLKQHDNTNNYTAKSLSYYKDIPPLGDKVYLDKTITKNNIELIRLQDELKITSVSFDFEESYEDELMWEFELTNGDYNENYDAELELYERLETLEEKTSVGSIEISPVVFVEVSFSGSDASDCSTSGITNGKLYEFNLNNVPAFANNVSYGVVALIPSNTVYEVVQNPSLPSDNLILCVAPSNGDWTTLNPADTITVGIIYYYSS